VKELRVLPSPFSFGLQLISNIRSIQMQNEIGADVIMALDDVISSQTTGERVEEVCSCKTIYATMRCFLPQPSRPSSP
jgi:queuine/archaeosine tRNA-ribosyltransferase